MTALTFGTLKTLILDRAHRPDLSASAADFVRQAEGMIRRDLVAYPLTVTLTDTDRVSGGLYTLPTGVLQVRSVWTADAQGNSYQIEQVGVPMIREQLTTTAPVLQWALRGPQIEFRGSPAAGASIELLYLGAPTALALDADTNNLLRDHEALYVDGALVQLYAHTEDLELEARAQDRFDSAIERLNQQYGRLVGGARPAVAYDFSPSGSY